MKLQDYFLTVNHVRSNVITRARRTRQQLTSGSACIHHNTLYATQDSIAGDKGIDLP